MKAPGWMHADGFAALSIFVGSAALAGWMGWPIVAILTGHPYAFRLLFFNAFWMPLLPILAVTGLWWGLKTLRDKANRRKCLLRALVPVLLLSPLLVWASSWGPLASYLFLYNHLLPEKIVQSVVSPDGRHEALIVREMSAGGWGQGYYLKTDGGKRFRVGHTGDFNKAHTIHWSPDSGLVIFEQLFNLLAARMPGRKAHHHALSYDTDLEGYIHAYPLDRIEFPRPGVFVVHYQDKITSQTVDLSAR